MQHRLILNPCTSVRGASLLAAITAMAMLSLTMFASMAYLDLLTTQNASLKQDFSISLVKTNIIRNLQSPSSWVNTVNDSANLFLACTADPANCLAVKSFVPLNIHDIENKVVVAGTAGSWYDYTGKICPAESTCPVQVKAQWKGVCNNEGTCTQAYVELDFLIRDKSGTQSKSKVSFLKNYFIGTSTSTMTTNVTVTSGDLGNAKAKVIVILDSSESMADNFAKVKSGLTNMMTTLAGKDVAVYFYTTAGAEYDYESYRFNFSVLKTHYESTSNNAEAYKNVASYVVTKPDDVTYNINLAQDMSRKIGLPIDPTLDSATIKSRMDSIFATYVAAPGTDKESGLCTLYRVLTEDGPNKILNDNDLAFFVIVSDEDDLMLNPNTLAVSCHKSQKIEEVTFAYNAVTNCDYLTEPCTRTDVRLHLAKRIAMVRYTQRTNDTTVSFAASVCNFNSGSNPVGYSPCPYQTVGGYTCSSREMNYINPDGTKNIIDCSVSVYDSEIGYSRGYNYMENTPELIANFCSGGAFSFQSISYTNVNDWVRQIMGAGYADATQIFCKVSASKSVATTTTNLQVTSFTQMDGTVTTNGNLTNEARERLGSYLVSTLKTKFGNSGFAVKAYIQDPIKDLGLCSLTDGTYGTTYKNFISRLESPLSGYESVCNSNYDVSFDTLSANILSKINNTYVFSSLTSDDKIVGISITRAGSSFTLDPSKYEVVSNKVIFQEGALQEGDQITLLLNNGTTGSW
ncbi:hypothetical protein [Bdellovibrio sp. HCB337]|uniref:hypothetical protein n=1 Tax=Bdellovibrio sp. HCB337 TaxID=3394358 RepID=UPI0039A5CD94